MQELESFKNLVRTILAGLSAVAAVWLTDALNPYARNVSRPALALLAAAIIIVAVVVTKPI
jgi:hypothetical protein